MGGSEDHNINIYLISQYIVKTVVLLGPTFYLTILASAHEKSYQVKP